MLEVSNLSRSYGDFLAVDAVSFSIQSGEIVGLLGHNGAGKTTIMKMLSGFLEPDQGRVTLDGIDMATNAKQAQRILGYLPENLPVYPEMSVADYLDYAADLKGLGGEFKTAEIRRAVKATELEAKLLDSISTLSRGYKQRVGVAQAILGKPRVLILDEPTNGLDPTQTDHMRALIRDIAQNATVILSTHIMQEVDALCDRVLIVNAGQLVVDAKLSNLKQSSQLLLSTSLGKQTLQEVLAEQVPAIGACTPVAGHDSWHHYQLQVHEGRDLNDTAAALVQAIVQTGGKVAGVQPIVRNLETLFREVSSGHAAAKEIKHAA
ncbi:MAG TPA: ABC transporter ATP-binding protein [Candidatus Acidoferrum sp.]|nr:ABC transporter ATP-binding protein [Candidatus Acidoferrum sp.]